MKLKAPPSESRMDLRDEENEPLSHTWFLGGVVGVELLTEHKYTISSSPRFSF